MPQESLGERGSYVDWTDEQLAAHCRDSRNDDAFAELLRRYQRSVFRLAVSILGQEFAADAEDVVQAVMLRVHQGLPSFRGDARVGSWIYRIAFNVSLTVKARVRFRAPHVSDELLRTMPSLVSGPDVQWRERWRQQTVLACIRELPEAYQSALRLYYWLETSVSDIAFMLDLPENTVKSYLFRARQLLRVMLNERGLDGL